MDRRIFNVSVTVATMGEAAVGEGQPRGRGAAAQPKSRISGAEASRALLRSAGKEVAATHPQSSPAPDTPPDSSQKGARWRQSVSNANMQGRPYAQRIVISKRPEQSYGIALKHIENDEGKVLQVYIGDLQPGGLAASAGVKVGLHLQKVSWWSCECVGECWGR